MNTSVEVQPQIEAYKNQIQAAISELQSAYFPQEDIAQLSPSKLHLLRQLSKRLNESCADLMAYQEKNRLSA